MHTCSNVLISINHHKENCYIQMGSSSLTLLCAADPLINNLHFEADRVENEIMEQEAETISPSPINLCTAHKCQPNGN